MAVVEEPDRTRFFTWAFTKVLRRLKYKRVWSSLELTKDFMQRSGQVNARACKPMPGLRTKVDEQRCGDMQVFKLGAAEGEEKPAAVIYLHGGGWVRPITKYHWRFVDSLCLDEGVSVYVPIYPEYPNAKSMQTVQALWGLYVQVKAENPQRPVVLMGDSAGAQLCLVLAQVAGLHGADEPEQIVLLSAPCETENFGAAEEALEKTDPMLSIVGVSYAYDQWSADFAMESVVLNPMQAELDPSLRIVHIIGTNDLLYPGALRFDQACAQAGVDIETYVFENMFHVFSLMPIPQARKSRKIVHEVLGSLCV